MTNGSPTGIIRVSNRCSRFENVLLVILSFLRDRFQGH
jgi:hypothetical protein